MIERYKEEYWCNVCGIEAIPVPHFYLRILCPKCQSNKDISNDLFSNAQKSKEIILAAKALVDKLRFIENNESYKGIWFCAANHGCIYDGPNYIKERDELVKLLS